MSPTSTRSRGTGVSDPVHVQQSGSGRGDDSRSSSTAAVFASVDTFQVGDQLCCDSASGLAGHVTGSDPGEQCLGLGGGEVFLRTARHQLQQQVRPVSRRRSEVLRRSSGRSDGPARVWSST